MSQHVPDIYRKYCLKLIEQALQAAVGLPPQVVTDESLFKQTVVEPGWKLLPQPLRLFGRDRMRWDDFLLTVRRSVYLAASGKVTLRPDALTRIEAAIDPFFSSKPTDRPKPSASTPPLSAAAVAIAVPVAPPAEEPTSEKPNDLTVGIDLGTTYSVISFLDSFGRPTSIPNAAGDFITPSVVLFEDGGTVVGKEAVSAAAMEPEKVAECVKRDMGTAHYRRKINGELLPPEVISSIILRSLKADAERKFNQPVRNAVITVPAYFDESRRQATVDAGKLAGLEVLDIINEPTAAAIAFGYQAGFINREIESAGEKPLRVLVYDLGGGTFDVTIVEIQGSSFKTIATDGDVLLGGKDWDEKIVEIGAQAFAEIHREDPRSHPGSNQELWQQAETAKKTLSERPKATLYVNHLGTRVKVEITRQEFEEATSPLLGRTRTTTEIVVRQAGLTWADIDKVLLVGGSTRMPAVVRMLEDISGRAPERSLSADEAVSHGAALFADLLLRRSGKKAGKAGFSVTNVNSHSLGIVGIEPLTGRKKAQVLIPKNTALPHSVKATFKTHKDGQKDIVIRVVEGESARPEACFQVGVCKVENLPPNLPKGWPIVVQYHYEEDGLLFVTAHVKGLTDAMTTTFQRDNRLSEVDLKLWSQYVAIMS